MSRGLALNLLASALTILATFAFLFAATMVGGSPLAAPAGADTRPIVHAFYDAINDVLRTGDPAALDVVVAPHFTMHGGIATVSRDRAGLARQLVASSAVAPDLQLEVEDLAVAGDRAVVHLGRMSDAGAAFLGVPFATTRAFWGQFDALRIEGDQVVELWTGGEPVPLLESFRQARLDPLLTPDQAMMFRRLRAEAGHTWTWSSTFQSRVLFVEAGAISIEVDPASPAPAFIVAVGDGPGQGRPVPPGAQARVQAGEALTLSPFVRYRLHGDPSRSALRAYEVAFPRFTGTSFSGAAPANPSAVGPAPGPKLPGRELLAETADPGLPLDALIVSFGRITLPAGSALALAEAPGPVLLTVEEGVLGIDQRQTGSIPVTTRLAPRGATIIPSGEAMTLHAIDTEPVVVFTVTIVPAHTGTGVAPTSHSTLPASESNAAACRDHGGRVRSRDVKCTLGDGTVITCNFNFNPPDCTKALTPPSSPVTDPFAPPTDGNEQPADEPTQAGGGAGVDPSGGNEQPTNPGSTGGGGHQAGGGAGVGSGGTIEQPGAADGGGVVIFSANHSGTQLKAKQHRHGHGEGRKR